MSHPVAEPPGKPKVKRILALAYEAVRFVGSGLLAFPIGLGVTALCHELLGMSEESAALIAILVLLVVNFALSRVLVFRSSVHPLKTFPRFVAVALVMRGLEYLMFLAALRILQVPYLLAMVAALGISSALKFYVYRTWVFNKVGPP